MTSTDLTGIPASGSVLVYPPHGVCKVEGIESTDIGGTSIEVIVFSLSGGGTAKLRLPVSRMKSGAIRSLSAPKKVDEALKVISGRSKKPQAPGLMWAHAAKEYTAKIGTGDIIKIAEVVRDLGRGREAHASAKRTLYETAVSLICSEISFVRGVEKDTILKEVEKVLDSEKPSEKAK